MRRCRPSSMSASATSRRALAARDGCFVLTPRRETGARLRRPPSGSTKCRRAIATSSRSSCRWRHGFDANLADEERGAGRAHAADPRFPPRGVARSGLAARPAAAGLAGRGRASRSRRGLYAQVVGPASERFLDAHGQNEEGHSAAASFRFPQAIFSVNSVVMTQARYKYYKKH